MGVYLHAYGGTFIAFSSSLAFMGLSPCVWRHPISVNEVSCISGSISMRMEAPLIVLNMNGVEKVYLHAYGGTSMRYCQFRAIMS